MTIKIILCWRSWGLGFEFSIGEREREFDDNVRQRLYPALALYLGPLTLEVGKEPVVLAYICAQCGDTHTGEPPDAFPLPPGFPICDACLDTHPVLADD